MLDKTSDRTRISALTEAERGLFLQTLIYFSNSVQNAFQLDYYPDRFADMPSDEPSAQRRGLRRQRETWGVINDQIGDKAWILGDSFSAVDICLFMLTTWLKPLRAQPPIDEFPNVKRIADAVEKRPSVQLVYEEGPFMRVVTSRSSWAKIRSKNIGPFDKKH